MNEHSFIMLDTEPIDKEMAILDAALELFSERNYGQTPVPMVAKRAGVATGTIYRYFPGKQGLVNALYQRWKAKLALCIMDDLDTQRPAETIFVETWGRLCDFVVEHPTAFLFLETHHHAAYLDDFSRQIAYDIDETLANLLNTWQNAGEVRPGDPEMLVAQVYGGLVGVVRQRHERGLAIDATLIAITIGPAWQMLAPNTNNRINQVET